MIVYSKKIIKFIHEIKIQIKTVLSQEIGLRVANSRFYNRQESCSYPISIVIYNDKKMLGYFDSGFYQLGFHECLMRATKIQLDNIIRHELAHYMTFINYGHVQPHGVEFRAYCRQLEWGEDVYQATSCIDDGEEVADEVESDVLRKVKKLMALATSSNQHEAEQAMIKSQQLLLKHNIESYHIEDEGDEKIFLKRIMKQQKKNDKMRAIAKILETFFVSVVFSRDQDFTYLEILGDAINIEIAEYVAEILDHELDRLWNQTRRQHPHLKGLIAKNSFFHGVAKGYCDKIEFLKKEHNSDTTQALMVLEKKLIDARAIVYPRLSSSTSKGSYCPSSASMGEQVGRLLNINPALNQSAKVSQAILEYCKY